MLNFIFQRLIISTFILRSNSMVSLSTKIFFTNIIDHQDCNQKQKDYFKKKSHHK